MYYIWNSWWPKFAVYCLCGISLFFFFLYIVGVIFDCKLIFSWYSSVEKYVTQTENAPSRYDIYSLFQEPGTATNPPLLIHIWSFKSPSCYWHNSSGFWIAGVICNISFDSYSTLPFGKHQDSLGFYIFSLGMLSICCDISSIIKIVFDVSFSCFVRGNYLVYHVDQKQESL